MFMSRGRNLIGVILLCCAAPVRGDDAIGIARPVVVPQVGVLQSNGTPSVSLRKVTAKIDVRGTTVTTQLDVHLQVKGKSPELCDVLVPVPPNAELLSVLPRGDGASKERAGFALLSGKAAKDAFRKLAVNLNDASVLEFYGDDVIVAQSLAISGGANSIVQVRYRESTSGSDGCRLPRSQRLNYATPWDVSAAIHPQQPVTALYCPSHPVVTQQTDGTLIANVRGNATAEPGPFRLSWTSGGEGVTGLVLAYPPQNGDDGYFLWLLQAPPASFPSSSLGTSNRIKREITLVIDRSASMEGKRIRQVREVSNRVLGKLQPGDAFNILTYNQTVAACAKAPLTNTAANVATAKTYLKNIQPRGGSNIYDALKTSLAQPAENGRLPIVLFFTDGLPTSGSPSEVKIRNLAQQQNPHHRRIYTVGIGVDLLSPLLNSLAAASGGRAVFILPKEHIAKKLAPTLDRLQNPVFTDVKLDVRTADGKDARATLRDVMPSRIPDLFAGDQVVVLGRYRGTQPRSLGVSGNFLGATRSFRFPFDPKAASAANTFLPRLWASRRIGQLVETIREEGAKAPAPYTVRVQKPSVQIARQSKEVLELTARYGVLTEYTAFLSAGGKPTAGWGYANYHLLQNFDNRAVRSRSGVASINQETNNTIQNGQVRLNGRNRYWDARMNCVAVGGVQQIGTLALFRRGNRWVDGRLLIPGSAKIPRDFGNSLGTAKPAATVQFGSPDYWKLLDKLSFERHQGVLALNNDVLLLQNGKPLLVAGPKRAAEPTTKLNTK
jgi:Ca-activated chloride channel homolog